MTQLIILLNVLLLVGWSKGDLKSTLTPCCQAGIQWSSDSYRCDNYPAPVANISDTDQLACLSVLQVCCMKQKQAKACEDGKQTALDNLLCAVMDTAAGAEEFRECCQCCRLGTEMRKLTRTSSVECQSPGLGEPCDTKVMECCQGRESANVSFTVNGWQNDDSSLMTTGLTTLTTVSPRLTSPRLTPSISPVMSSAVMSSTTGSYVDNSTINIDSDCDLNNPCAQICVPQSGGGVECRCYDGYRLQGYDCDDIDECAENLAMCAPEQQCVNTPGRYTCNTNTCPVGYELDPNTGRCNPGRESCATGFKYNPTSTRCEDQNECGLGIDDCGVGERCENTVGSYVCRRQRHCGTGYTLDEESQTCQDNDECKLGTHNCARGYKCTNIQGSFRCERQPCERGFRFDREKMECVLVKCPTGLKLNWANKCQDINECKEYGTSICRRHQRCVNTRGSYYCRSVVNCPPGYEATENSGCQDINECDRGSHKCGEGQECVNRQGTYFCQCPRGWTHDNANGCIDVDECSYGAQICPSNSKCVNSIGSFSCECVDGLVADGKDRCADVDECEQEGICQQKCVNVLGTFFCTCDHGYQLRDDKRSCEDIDECTQFRGRGGTTGVCGGHCINTPGSYRCECPDGWRIKYDGRGCDDINECLVGNPCTDTNSKCINTQGGYKCPVVSCPEGFLQAGRATNSVRCKRISTSCPECKRGLISRTFNFISFKANVMVPAPLFSMKGSRLRNKYYSWKLELEDARPQASGIQAATVDNFSVDEWRVLARVSLVKRIEGPQDLVLKLTMNVTSYKNGKYKMEGFAESRIYLFVTPDE